MTKLQLFIIDSTMDLYEPIKHILDYINDPQWVYIKENGGNPFTKEEVIEALSDLQREGYVDCYEEGWDEERKEGKAKRIEKPLSEISEIDDVDFGPAEKGREAWKILEGMYPEAGPNAR